MNVQLLAVIVDGLVAVAVIAAAVVLSALGRIDASTTIAIIGAGLALISGSGKAAVALYASPPSQPRPVPPAQ